MSKDLLTHNHIKKAYVSVLWLACIVICICIFHPWRHDAIQKHVSLPLINTHENHSTSNNTYNTDTNNNDVKLHSSSTNIIPDQSYSTHESKNIFHDFIKGLKTARI